MLRLILLFIFFLSNYYSFAGAMGNAMGNSAMGGPGVPINGGLGILLIGGLIYGIIIIYKNKNE